MNYVQLELNAKHVIVDIIQTEVDVRNALTKAVQHVIRQQDTVQNVNKDISCQTINVQSAEQK